MSLQLGSSLLVTWRWRIDRVACACRRVEGKRKLPARLGWVTHVEDGMAAKTRGRSRLDLILDSIQSFPVDPVFTIKS